MKRFGGENVQVWRWILREKEWSELWKFNVWVVVHSFTFLNPFTELKSVYV